MKIQDVISYVDDIRKNSYSQNAKIVMISDIDGRVRDEIMKEFSHHEILRIADQAAYTMPIGVSFDQISRVYVGGREVPKIDYRTFEREGCFLNEDGKIEFYPVPTQTDADPGIRIISQDRAARYTTTDYDNNVDLLIPEPYTDLYAQWIMAKMNYLDKQYDDYNNDIVVFNNNFMSFAKWYNSKNPLTGLKIKNVW